MDVLTIAIAMLAILGLVALIAGAESRDGYDGAGTGRSLGR